MEEKEERKLDNFLNHRGCPYRFGREVHECIKEKCLAFSLIMLIDLEKKIPDKLMGYRCNLIGWEFRFRE